MQLKEIFDRLVSQNVKYDIKKDNSPKKVNKKKV